MNTSSKNSNIISNNHSVQNSTSSNSTLEAKTFNQANQRPKNVLQNASAATRQWYERNFANSLLNIDHPSNSKKLAAFASVLLSVGSGITTFNGLLYYVDVVLATIITIGIQSLLLISAWQIHSDRLDRMTKLSFGFAMALTMLISVFFSYSDLLDGIYQPEARVGNEVQRVRSEAYTIIEPLREDLEGETSQLAVGFYQSLNEYDKFVNQTVGASTGQIYDAQLKNIKDSLAAKARIEQEIQKKRENNGNAAKVKQADRNINYLENRLRNRSNAQQINQLKLDAILAAQANYDDAFERLNGAPDSITGKNLAKYDKAIVELAKTVNTNVSNNRKIALSSLSMPDTLAQLATGIGQINDFLAWKSTSFDVEIPDDILVLRQQLNELLNRIPHIEDRDREKLLSVTNNISKYGGEASHFALAFGALFIDFNILALFALTIAFAIDTLILLCGFLGKDRALKEVSKSGIESSIRSVFTAEYDKKKDIMNYEKVGRMLTFLNNSNINHKTANGIEYPIAVYQSDIEKNDLTKEFAVLNAHGMTRVIDNNVYMITDDIISKIRNLLEKEEAYLISKKMELIKGHQFDQKTLFRVLDNLKIKDSVKVVQRTTRIKPKSRSSRSSATEQKVNIKEVISLVARNPVIGVEGRLVKWLGEQIQMAEHNAKRAEGNTAALPAN